MRSLQLGLLLAAVCTALAADGHSVAAAGQRHAGSITFFVYHHNCEGHVAGRSGVEVLRVGREGTLSLGSTDARGRLTLKTADILSPGAIALLFCNPEPKEICSAIRLEPALLQRYPEFVVHLPEPEIVNMAKEDR